MTDVSNSLKSVLWMLCAWLAGHGATLAQGFSPEEAVKRMKLPEGFEARLVVSEPAIAQPVCIEFDDRGRLWVIQYLQYPNPSGLKRAKVDRWSRTTYDRVPEPPPRGPKGADRITILEDFDANGKARKAKDFVSGLNLATGLAFGHGGVFVLQVPYLLFYPDKNGDDIPDSDPEVLLTGFGMEDASSVANSLTWGPDGWLYGAQGTTVTANIRGIEFQQGIWRYHPITKRFELFCEGGGNTWGIDFDEDGNLIFSSNLGGHRNWHGVQGGYYWKSFGKHGALHNPYAYGYINFIPYKNFTGGHVTDGGIIYQGDSFPEKFRGQYIANDLLGHAVQWHNMEKSGSTFKASYGGELLTSNDTWFDPTDLTMGPDGSLFTADWCDKRTAHPDPDADWDRSNGRVYKIQYGHHPESHFPAGLSPEHLDMTKLSSAQLVSLLDNKNNWFVCKARRILADRRDPGVVAPLRKLVLDGKNDHLALESLWALYVSGGFDERLASRLLDHRNPRIRSWTVRLLGDENKVSAKIAPKLLRLADTETDSMVRSQLASTAKRLPAKDGLAIAQKIALRNLDAQDAHIPLLLWWAVEHHAVAALPDVETFFTSPAAWKSELVRDVIVERLMRRWIAEGSAATYDACARLLAGAPDAGQRHRLLAAIELGFHDRPVAKVTFGTGGLFASAEMAEVRTNTATTHIDHVSPALSAQLDALWRDDTTDPVLIHIGAHTGRAAATARARALLTDAAAERELRVKLIQMLGELGDPSDAERLLKLVGDAPESLQLAALDALPAFDLPELATELLERYPKLADRVRSRVRQVLLSRKAWARIILHEVDTGHLPAADFTVEQLRPVALHEDKELDELVRKYWGRMSSGTTEEKLAEMRRFGNDLRAALGDPARGHEIFTRLCGVCHTMYGEGGKVGPDLTEANRTDREFLLASIVDPSAAIRKEYLAYDVETKDGRMLSGVIADQSGGNLTLGIATGERIVVPQSQVVSLRESTVSIMPEGLVKPLKPQELRDLFGYLESKKPLAAQNKK